MKHKVRLKGILKTYLRWPVLLSIFFAAMDVQLFIYNQKAGVIGFFYFIVYRQNVNKLPKLRVMLYICELLYIFKSIYLILPLFAVIYLRWLLAKKFCRC